MSRCNKLMHINNLLYTAAAFPSDTHLNPPTLTDAGNAVAVSDVMGRAPESLPARQDSSPGRAGEPGAAVSRRLNSSATAAASCWIFRSLLITLRLSMRAVA